MLLICQCGQKLNTPGATPGRVGKCPRCGSMLKIDAPGPVAESAPEPEHAARPKISAVSTYRQPARSRTATHRQTWADGLVTIPLLPEQSFHQTWNYPLRNASGIGLLGFIPPLLWIGSSPLFILIPMVISGSAVTLLASILQIPLLILFGFVGGHVLQFLGNVVVTSCLGEVALPRQASWVPAEIGEAALLWVWAGLAGGVMGAWPALVYWLRCGDIDWFDQIVLIELILPGIAYGQMALVLALTDNSPWSAGNPFRVLGAIRRGGWAYFWPCLINGSLLALTGWLFGVCIRLRNEIVGTIAFWLWWVVAIYVTIVGLRWLGLFCYRSRAVAVAPRYWRV